jgi:hypothetical protein
VCHRDVPQAAPLPPTSSGQRGVRPAPLSWPLMHAQPSVRPSGPHPSQATMTQQCVGGRERAEVVRAGHTAPSPPATSPLCRTSQTDIPTRWRSPSTLPSRPGSHRRCRGPRNASAGSTCFRQQPVTRSARRRGQSSRGRPAEAIRSLSRLIAWFEIPKRLPGSTTRLNSAAQESAAAENTRGRNRCRILPTP